MPSSFRASAPSPFARWWRFRVWHGKESITSLSHPALQRPDGLMPTRMQTDNSSKILSSPRPQRPNDPKTPRLLCSQCVHDGNLVIHDFEENNLEQNSAGALHANPEGQPLGALGGTGERCIQPGLTIGTKMMRRRVGPFDSSDHDRNSQRSVIFALCFSERDYVLITEQRRTSSPDLRQPAYRCRVVRSATGNDDYFENVAMDVREFRGQFAQSNFVINTAASGAISTLTILMTSADSGSSAADRPHRPHRWPRIPACQHQGVLTLENGQLSWRQAVDSEIFLTVNSLPRASRAPGAIRLLNGEVWNAEVKTVEGAGRKKLLNIRSQIRRTESSALFLEHGVCCWRAGRQQRKEPSTARTANRQQSNLGAREGYRSARLGVIPVPRASALRFVLAKPPHPKADRGRNRTFR